MDAEQPRIDGAPLLQRIRHYRNIPRMPELVGYFLERYAFTSVAEHQGYSTELPGRPAASESAQRAPTSSIEVTTEAPRSRLPVTIVVPCYNEEVVIPYLRNTLDRVQQQLREYDLTFVFVDDASTDRTWESLTESFGQRLDCLVLTQAQNGGPAKAILAGIRAAKTEIVCSIDCDCSYDPHILATMIPLLEDGVDLVTASPYHPLGGVANVPPWRLFLSRGCSRLYRIVLGERIHTFTACFRVYRRSTIERIRVERPGFLGIAELVGKLSVGGGTIREQPALLETRVMGRSSMKVARTVIGHLGLLSSLLWLRIRGGGRDPIADVPPKAPVTPAGDPERAVAGPKARSSV
jgi:hypothetical protein